MFNTQKLMKSFKPQWLVPAVMLASIIFVIGFQVLNFEPINVSQNSKIISSKLIYIEQSDDLATKILNENSDISTKISLFSFKIFVAKSSLCSM